MIIFERGKPMITFISPAKGFNDIDISGTSSPEYIIESKSIVNKLKTLGVNEISKIMKINSELAKLNYDRFINFKFDKNGTPAILSYSGLQYQNINVFSLTDDDLQYANSHIRILSGLYGIVKPLDSIYPYRLEMMTKINIDGHKNLYEYWSDKLYKSLKRASNGVIVNLASDEYSKCVKKYVDDNVKYITCIFKIEKNNTLKTLATASKTARGNMINYIIKNRIDNYKLLKNFDIDAYKFNEKLSNEDTNLVEYVFVKKI